MTTQESTSAGDDAECLVLTRVFSFCLLAATAAGALLLLACLSAPRRVELRCSDLHHWYATDDIAEALHFWGPDKLDGRRHKHDIFAKASIEKRNAYLSYLNAVLPDASLSYRRC